MSIFTEAYFYYTPAKKKGAYSTHRRVGQGIVQRAQSRASLYLDNPPKKGRLAWVRMNHTYWKKLANLS